MSKKGSQFYEHMLIPCFKICSLSILSLQYGVFETATRNTGTQIVGKNIANPIGILHAAADLLQYLHLEKHSTRLRSAIQKTINEDKLHTPGRFSLFISSNCSVLLL